MQKDETGAVRNFKENLLTFGCEIKGKFDAIFQDLEQSKEVFEKLIGGEFSSGYCFGKLFDEERVCSGLEFPVS